MSLKAELEIWAAALQAYNDQDLETSPELFSKISDTSKIIGLIYATLGEHEAAVDHFTAATELDQYLAVAYFQSGVSNSLLARYDAAHSHAEPLAGSVDFVCSFELRSTQSCTGTNSSTGAH